MKYDDDFVSSVLPDEAKMRYDGLEEASREKTIYKKYMLYSASACELISKEGKINIPDALDGNANLRKFLEDNKCVIMGINDPDAASFKLQEVYRVLWPNISRQPYMLSGEWIQSDTMTSAHQRVNDYMQYMEDSRAAEGRDSVFHRNGRQRYSELFALNMYCEDAEKFVRAMDFSDQARKSEPAYQLSDFLRLYHTAGNYCPVPFRFNAARSGHYASHDYWDLTLIKILEYYDSDQSNEAAIQILSKDLLHGKGDGLCCKAWLDYFGSGRAGWARFVEENFMTPFVDENKNPIPFCKDHSWENTKISDFAEFFENVCSMIEARGKIIAEKYDEAVKVCD